MQSREQYKEDIELIFSKKNHLGGDNWTTEDYRIGKGSPFSARDVAIFLSELGYNKGDKEVQELADAIFKTWRDDGKFKISPSGSVFPCHTITALRVLCYLGYADDVRLRTTLSHLFDIQHNDGGWRCKTVKLGESPYTDCSNPGTTLEALDAFRYTQHLNKDDRLDKSIKFLLEHWEVKRPLGPCHFGIGTLFMQTEFPFLRYNLFYYCYTLSFYEIAKKDSRFKEAVKALGEKTKDGQMVIESTNRLLGKLSFCKKGAISDLATKRYTEILQRCEM